MPIAKQDGPFFLQLLQLLLPFCRLSLLPFIPSAGLELFHRQAYFVVYFLIMLFFCALLSIGPDKEAEKINKTNKDKDQIFESLGNFFVRNGKIFIPIATLLIAVCIMGAMRLQVNLNTNKMMGTKLPHVRDQIYISNSSIGVIMSYDIALLFESKEEAINIKNLNKLDQLADYIEGYNFIKGTRSVNESLKEFNQIRFGDKPEQHRLPPSNASLRGLINLYSRLEGNDLGIWIGKNQESLRMTVKVIEFSSADLSEHISGVRAEIRRLFPKEEYPKHRSAYYG